MIEMILKISDCRYLTVDKFVSPRCDEVPSVGLSHGVRTDVRNVECISDFPKYTSVGAYI